MLKVAQLATKGTQKEKREFKIGRKFGKEQSSKIGPHNSHNRLLGNCIVYTERGYLIRRFVVKG